MENYTIGPRQIVFFFFVHDGNFIKLHVNLFSSLIIHEGNLSHATLLFMICGFFMDRTNFFGMTSPDAVLEAQIERQLVNEKKKNQIWALICLRKKTNLGFSATAHDGEGRSCWGALLPNENVHEGRSLVTNFPDRTYVRYRGLFFFLIIRVPIQVDRTVDPSSSGS